VAQIRKETIADRISQRQEQRATALLLVHGESAAPPRDIFDSQTHNLTGAQAIGRNEQEHGVIAPANGSRAVDGAQERQHRLPGQCTWQLLPSVEARCINTCFQTGGRFAARREKPQKRPELRDHVLHRATPETTPVASDKLFNLVCRHLHHRREVPGLVDVVDELRRGRPVIRDCTGGQATNLLQVRDIVVQLALDRRWGSERGQQTSMVEIPLQQANHGGRIDIVLRPASGWGTGAQIVTRDLGNRSAAMLSKPLIDTPRRADVTPERLARVAFADKELREPIQRRPQNGQGRVATVDPREYVFEHRDLLAESDGPMLPASVM